MPPRSSLLWPGPCPKPRRRLLRFGSHFKGHRAPLSSRGARWERDSGPESRKAQLHEQQVQRLGLTSGRKLRLGVANCRGGDPLEASEQRVWTQLLLRAAGGTQVASTVSEGGLATFHNIPRVPDRRLCRPAPKHARVGVPGGRRANACLTTRTGTLETAQDAPRGGANEKALTLGAPSVRSRPATPGPGLRERLLRRTGCAACWLETETVSHASWLFP